MHLRHEQYLVFVVRASAPLFASRLNFIWAPRPHWSFNLLARDIHRPGPAYPHYLRPQWVWRGGGGEEKRLRQEDSLITEKCNGMVDGASHDDAFVAVDGCVDKAVFAAVWVAQ